MLRLDRSTGKIASVAGSGTKGYAGDGGPAIKAQLNEPYEVRFDRAGNMLVVEMQNQLVRQVDRKSELISTAARKVDAFLILRDQVEREERDGTSQH